MDIFKRMMTKTKWVGIGGWDCSCCRPRRKDHTKVHRNARRMLKALDRKLFNAEE